MSNEVKPSGPLEPRVCLTTAPAAPTGNGAGRPRAFDVDEALDRALAVFWQKGYEGTTLSDLTHAMGINRPSLYAAFGNKESLFHRVMDRYAEGPASVLRDALGEPTARAVAARFLETSGRLLAAPDHPPGCMTVLAALSTGEDAEPVRHELCRRRSANEAVLRERFERARGEGDLAPDADPAALARYLMAVSQGMSVQASGGASEEELLEVAALALRAWPA